MKLFIKKLFTFLSTGFALTIGLLGFCGLYGCVPQPEIIHDDAVYFSDSNTCLFKDTTPGVNQNVFSAAEQAGIPINCKTGRKLVDLTELPDDKELIFLNLGINDAINNIDPDVYGDQLDALIGSTGAVVYCVLPVHEDINVVIEYREQMQDHCVLTIDPYDVGIQFAQDGFHWTHPSQGLHATQLTPIAQEYAL